MVIQTPVNSRRFHQHRRQSRLFCSFNSLSTWACQSLLQMSLKLFVRPIHLSGLQLVRSAGELWVEPCDGIRLPKGSLIRLVAPIYGLDDSPLNWHLTVVRFLEDLGFNRSLFEPCWFVKRVEGRIEAMVLVEVDDFNIAATEEYMPDLQEKLKARFKFGKWEHQEADFAGRSVKILSDRVIMHQHKYIVEKLAAVKLAVGRRADKTAPLDDEEFEEFRSMLYKVAWLAHQTRPEAAGIVSILSSRLHRATVHDVVCLNKVITHMRQTAQQPLVLHRFDMSKMILIAASDAGGVAGKQVSREVPGEELEDTIQGAFLIFASDNMPSASRKVKVSLLSWRSSKLRRRVASTLAGEALAFNQAISELEWLQVLIRDIVCGDVELTDWTQSLTPFVAVLPDTCKLKGTLDQGLITDAKSLYDTIQKESPSSRQDRRTAIEIAIILNSIKKADTIVRWAPHPRMVADVLTKDDLSRSNGALEEVLRTGRLALWDESTELQLRKSCPASKNRSKRASEQRRARCEGLDLLVSQTNIKSWELFQLFTLV